MTTRTCPTCNTPIPRDAGFCPNCGGAAPTDLLREPAYGHGRLDRFAGKVSGKPTTGLPPDMLRLSVRRLRVLTLLYAVGFFMANFSIEFFDPTFTVLSRFTDWGPGVISISAALIVFGLCTWSRLPSATLMTIGLVFEVVGSFGIAMAQYWGVWEGLEYQPEHLMLTGLSWVAVWTVMFTIVVSTKPRLALIAALASSSSCAPVRMGNNHL